jgi:hypothetical protein
LAPRRVCIDGGGGGGGDASAPACVVRRIFDIRNVDAWSIERGRGRSVVFAECYGLW